METNKEKWDFKEVDNWLSDIEEYISEWEFDEDMDNLRHNVGMVFNELFKNSGWDQKSILLRYFANNRALSTKFLIKPIIREVKHLNEEGKAFLDSI